MYIIGRGMIRECLVSLSYRSRIALVSPSYRSRFYFKYTPNPKFAFTV